MPNENAQKSKARPKRSTAKRASDRDLGLWIDYEMLRRHQGRAPQILIDDPVSAPINHYLELADLALGNGKPKKKVQRRGLERLIP